MLDIEELYRARQIAHMFDMQLRRELKLTLPAAMLLYGLRKKPGRKQKDLCDEFKVNRSVISKGLKILRRKKLVRWVWQGQVNKITPEGRRVLAGVVRRVKKLNWEVVAYVY